MHSQALELVRQFWNNDCLQFFQICLMHPVFICILRYTKGILLLFSLPKNKEIWTYFILINEYIQRCPTNNIVSNYPRIAMKKRMLIPCENCKINMHVCRDTKLYAKFKIHRTILAGKINNQNGIEPKSRKASLILKYI